MHKIILMMLLAVINSSAMAEWVEAGSYNGYDPLEITAYADPASIRKVGDIVQMRILIVYKPVEMVDGKQQKLVIGKAESEESQPVFECKETQFSSESVPVSPDSIDEGLWKIACGN